MKMLFSLLSALAILLTSAGCHADVPYSESEVTLPGGADGVTLAGTLTVPSVAAKGSPAVIFITGSGQQNRDEEVFGHRPFAVIADSLARRGVASLRCDDRGVGGSTGDVAAMTTSDVIADAGAMLRYLRSDSRFGSVGAIGHSEGARAAVALAADSLVDFAVGIAGPAVRGDTLLVEQNRAMLRLTGLPGDVTDNYCTALYGLYAAVIGGTAPDKDLLVDSLTASWPVSLYAPALRHNLRAVADAVASSPWLRYFLADDPTADLARAGKGVLLVYGLLDAQVTPDPNYSAAVERTCGADVRLYDGMNHLMQHAVTGAPSEYQAIKETIAPEVVGAIADFILGAAR